jgi:hypothetical protein
MLQDMAATGSLIDEKDSDSAKKTDSTIKVIMELGRQKGFEVIGLYLKKLLLHQQCKA